MIKKALITMKRKTTPYEYNEDVLESGYSKIFIEKGVTLIPMPNQDTDISRYLENMDALIISGGNNVNPISYGSEKKVEDVWLERDTIEKKMLTVAIKERIPVFGICRGMQMINVFFGGKLVDGRDENSYYHTATRHKVSITNENIINQIGKKELKKNSYHGFYINEDTLSEELKSFAYAGRVIEGVYHPNLPIAGVQWHPEREEKEDLLDDFLLNKFIQEDGFWRVR